MVKNFLLAVGVASLLAAGCSKIPTAQGATPLQPTSAQPISPDPTIQYLGIDQQSVPANTVTRQTAEQAARNFLGAGDGATARTSISNIDWIQKNRQYQNPSQEPSSEIVYIVELDGPIRGGLQGGIGGSASSTTPPAPRNGGMAIIRGTDGLVLQARF
jgi:hypothetical protein